MPLESWPIEAHELSRSTIKRRDDFLSIWNCEKLLYKERIRLRTELDKAYD
jgi:hypothetical protein